MNLEITQCQALARHYLFIQSEKREKKQDRNNLFFPIDLKIRTKVCLFFLFLFLSKIESFARNKGKSVRDRSESSQSS